MTPKNVTTKIVNVAKLRAIQGMLKKVGFISYHAFPNSKHWTVCCVNHILDKHIIIMINYSPFVFYQLKIRINFCYSALVVKQFWDFCWSQFGVFRRRELIDFWSSHRHKAFLFSLSINFNKTMEIYILHELIVLIYLFKQNKYVNM